jgi:proline iminopeptidase
METAKENLNKIGTQKQIDVCEKYLWNGSFGSVRDVNRYFKLMDPLYFYNHKKKSKNSSSKQLKSGGLKRTLSYDVLNVGFSGFLKHFNFIPKLKKIKCPTLVMVGRNDWICVPSHSKTMAKQIPNATLKIFNKCGHALSADAKDRYLDEIKRFLLKKRKSKGILD